MLATLGFGQATGRSLPQSCKDVATVKLPAEAEAVGAVKASPDCAAYKWYRGIGRERDLQAARQCAWTERAAQLAKLPQNAAEPTAWVVGGGLILADIYWNGDGVEKDRQLALRMACEGDAELGQFVLDELKKNPKLGDAAGGFEFCDYGTTTFTMSFCSSYANEIRQKQSAEFERKFAANLSPAEEQAFAKLQAARDAYIDAHKDEVELDGSFRAMRVMGSQQMLRDQFRADLLHFESTAGAAKSTKDFDALLAKVLAEKSKALAAQSEAKLGEGAVAAEGLQGAEKAWESYRTAWLEFAQVHAPAKRDAVRQQITKERYLLVKSVVVY